jgi:sec-independent protein translocase protein TatA
MLDFTTFAMLGPQELWPIAIVAIILFGAKKLPEMARGLGEGMKEFKKAVKEVNEDAPASAPKAESPEEIERRISK